MEEKNLPDSASLVRQLDGTPVTPPSTTPIVMKKISLSPRSRPRFIKVLGGFAVFFLIILLFVIGPSRKLVASVRQLVSSGREVATYLKNQDLAGAKSQLNQVSSNLDAVDANLKRFGWARFVPIAKKYYSDGRHAVSAGKEIVAAADVAIEAITPYADVIGLKGLATTGDGAKTAEDRINFILNTLDKIKPQLEQIGNHLQAAQKEVDQIDPNRYPKNLGGHAIRSKLVTGITLLDQASGLVSDAKPLIEYIPYMLGLDSP